MTRYQRMIQAYNKREKVCQYSPLHIYIEPTNVCNLKCAQCSVKIMKRKKGFMELNFFYDLIEQCKVMQINWVYLFHMGESTLHKDLKKMIEYAEKMKIKIRLHSNGTHDVSELKVDDLHISLNSTHINQIEQNLDKLILKGRKFKIDSINGIAKKIPEKYMPYIYKKSFYNWQGDVGIREENREKIPCSHPYKSFAVLWDGRCVPCCVDYDAKYIIGDAKQQSLRDIWNSQEMQSIRLKQNPMCSFCNLERAPEPERAGYEER